MAQLEEKLSALLSDEEGRQRFLQLASMLSGSGGASSSRADTDSDSQAADDTEQISPPPPSDNNTDDRAGVILELLPRLLGALSGSGEGLDEKKLNLIRALSPYLNTRRSQYIDRAIRMASMAKAAKDTLGMLGR